MLHLFFKAIIVLLCACACTAEQRKIDWSSLVLCSGKCRLPWQTCAQCTLTNFDGPVGYCSDRTEKGLCEYKDDQISCQCGHPKDDIFYKAAQITGYCQRDADCQPMHRCATCLDSKYPNLPYRGISPQNLCSTSQNGPYQDACAPIWRNSCSCGQMLPETNEAAAALEQNPAFANAPLFSIPPPIADAEFDPKDAWNEHYD